MSKSKYVIKMKRTRKGKTSTLGRISIDNVSMFTLEDRVRDLNKEEKVSGNTAIPAGIYKLKLRRYGGHHKRYSERFKIIHNGMIELENVPHFIDILIHVGNTISDTEGCILVGSGASMKMDGSCDSTISQSSSAYQVLYQKILGLMEIFSEVYLDISEEFWFENLSKVTWKRVWAF